ncbi:tetratricopeptide repeat protein [Streptomyces sp. NPDC004539]|uniref:tetratricopeptide repeat protein n=1 Tax=Streptomyces sp. NPDC004539 TaxID=3154280 RepID=UPI0033A964C1
MRGDHIDFRGGTFYGPVYGKVEGGVPAGPVSTLPGAPAGFTGRAAEVAAVLGALERDRVVSVSGLAGVGKTALAVAVAHEARGRGMFPGGVLFVDLRGYDEVPVSPEQAVSSLLGVPDGDFARYRNELASRDAVLVVLDNAGGSEQVVPLFPGEGVGHRVLVTSRDVLDSLPVRSVVVEALSVEAACGLVERGLEGDVRVREEGSAVRELVDVCGRLPLALVIVSAVLRRRRGLGVGELVVELREAGDRVGVFVADGVDQYGRSLVLRPVFDAMYRRLGEESARVFRRLGVAPGAVIDSVAGQMLGGVVGREWSAAADDLVAASLLGVPAEGRGWEMHDLVRLYAGSLMSEGEAREAKVRLLTSYVGRLSAAHLMLKGSDRPDELAALMWFEADRVGILNAVRWAEDDDRQTALLALRTALVLLPQLSSRRAFGDMLDVSTLARDTARRLGAVEYEASAVSGVAAALLDQHRFAEALEVSRRSLELYERVGDSEGQFGAWSNIAVALLRLDRPDEAFSARTEAFIHASHLEDPSYAAMARARLAAALFESGPSEEVCGVLCQAVAELDALGLREELAEPLFNLGQALRGLGRHDEALIHVVRSLKLNGEFNNWREKASTWGVIGVIHRDLGRPHEALRAFSRSLAWSRLFVDKRQAALSWCGLGVTLTVLRRFREAADAFRTAGELSASLGDWAIHGETHFNLAVPLRKLRRKREARAAFRSAAEAYERAGMPEEAARARELAGDA